MKISATIITCNEERRIARAIESLRCCDEIVVVDSGSTDRTVEIAQQLNTRVIESPWPGYAKQKNLAAAQAANDWILSLDADEALSEALEAEIWQLRKKSPEFDAYTMPRMAQYVGRWILHSGWYPDRKVRLYDRRQANWVGEFVHESVEVHGTVGHLDARQLHDAGGAGDRLAARTRGLAHPAVRAGVDVRAHLRAAARLPRRPGGPHDRLHGGPVHVPEIRQSAEHVVGERTSLPNRDRKEADIRLLTRAVLNAGVALYWQTVQEAACG
jgi:glycosyltransferase involved in cell wall biosynthesis